MFEKEWNELTADELRKFIHNYSNLEQTYNNEKRSHERDIMEDAILDSIEKGKYTVENSGWTPEIHGQRKRFIIIKIIHDDVELKVIKK